MLEVIAAGITTLDEARYFAAMGAGWIGFDAERLSIDEIHTISGWVVGPRLFAEFDSVQEGRIFELTNKTQLHGICVPASYPIPLWYTGITISKFIMDSGKAPQSNSQILLIQIDSSEIDVEMIATLRSAHNQSVWLETFTSLESLVKVLSRVDLQGVVMRCIQEDNEKRTSFEEYDVIFDALSRMSAK